MGKFKGRRKSVQELITDALVDKSVATGDKVDVTRYKGDFTVSKSDLRTDAAETAEGLASIESGSLLDLWRHGILQTLDDYNSCKRRGGVDLARRVFEREPPPTPSPVIDAAYAALAEYLGHQDGWEPRDWVRKETRRVDGVKYISPFVNERIATTARNETPDEFRRRGIYITSGALSRV